MKPRLDLSGDRPWIVSPVGNIDVLKHQFVCQKCEYELNADYNASKTIARKLLKRLHSGQKCLRVEAHPVSVRYRQGR